MIQTITVQDEIRIDQESNMPLSIGLKRGEGVLIGESTYVKISEVRGNKVIVSVDAPASDAISRIGEYEERKHKESNDES